ncbi:epimerase [uncultured Tateyamaria sp.]|uniref:epimerase n=1 Tax=Tateyamaria sp. 1078 TaxID=3417464 RepID=UPI00262BF4ED|nr:epimerase [uncultured Tateyamaria sp.]
MEKVLILGASGRFGRAAVTAFADPGWAVTQTARRWPQSGAGRVAVDPSDADALATIAQGHEVIVNALNPPYPDWATEVPRMTRAVIAAAQASGATVMIPGNVYNYGAGMPEVLREDTAWNATTRKGNIRVRMERAYLEADVRTIVLRGGDFLEAAQSGNWFDDQIAAKAWQGKVMYPGPRDVVHAWAWLPDMARAMAGLAAKRGQFDRFEEFGFAGYALTGDALISLVEQAMGRPLRVSGMPWTLVRAMGLVSPLLREVAEMRYLWSVPHRIDGTKLAQALPDLTLTPPAEAIATALAAWAPVARAA